MNLLNISFFRDLIFQRNHGNRPVVTWCCNIITANTNFANFQNRAAFAALYTLKYHLNYIFELKLWLPSRRCIARLQQILS